MRSEPQGYESVLRQYLRPRFANQPLDKIRRDDLKEMISELVTRKMSRNTIRNAICVVRKMFNEAIEAELVESNPAMRLGRFTRTAKTPDVKSLCLIQEEVRQFLEAANDVCPEYYPLFLTALRAGLRRGELVALQWGDVQFGSSENDPNRFILVRHNYLRREHTNTKSKKSPRVDLSKELRAVLLQIRDQRLLRAYQAGKNKHSVRVGLSLRPQRDRQRPCPHRQRSGPRRRPEPENFPQLTDPFAQWYGLTSDGRVLLMRDRSVQEIYAMTLDKK